MKLPTIFLNPVLLRASFFSSYDQPPGIKFAKRTVYDYELEYYTRSDGGVIINGKMTDFGRGDINIRKPGQSVQGVPPYECYILCVDLIGNTNRKSGYSFGSPEEAQEKYENPLISSLPDKIRTSKPDLVEGLFESILQNQQSKNDLSEFRLRSSLYFLFSEIFTEVYDLKVSGNTFAIRKAVEKIRKNYSDRLRIDEIAKESGMSKAFFHRRFFAETGTTPGNMITSLRIEKAKNLLSITTIPIGEVGAACGYDDGVFFSRIFKSKTGMTPTAYRKMLGVK